MKFYTKPEIEISVFATEDIITASNVGTDEEETPTTPVASLTKGADLNDNTTEFKYSDIF